MILAGAGYSRLPLFKKQEGFFVLSNSSACFGFCRHFEYVLLNTIVKLPHALVLLNMVLEVFSVLNTPAA